MELYMTTSSRIQINSSLQCQRKSVIKHKQKLAGLGKKLWNNIDPVQYVRDERQQWANTRNKN